MVTSNASFHVYSTRIYPFLLGIYPVIALYVANSATLSFRTAVIPLGAAITLTFFSLLLTYFYLKDSAKAALSTAVFLLFFFTYGHAYGALFTLFLRFLDTPAGMVPYSDFNVHLHWLLSASFLVLLLTAVRMIRRAKLARILTVNRSAARFTGALLILLAGFHGLGALDSTRAEAIHNAGIAPVSAPHSGTPDIYHVVLDGYARGDILEKHYDFDNKGFLGFLQKHGFQIPAKSTTNYTWTFLSLASTLNMDYVQRLITIDEHERDWARLAQHIDQGTAIRFLRERGYQHVHLSSTWGPTYRNRLADQELRCSDPFFAEEFNRVLFEASWLRVFESLVGINLARCHLENFDTLANLPNTRSPKYVFAHFILPHHPYLFDKNGNILRNVTVANQLAVQGALWSDKAAYLEQLQFVNKRVLNVVQALLEGSEQPPVILVHSDHGPKVPGIDRESYNEARFANFVALHLPDSSPVPADISAVNLLRFVLNEVFDESFEFLPDSVFDSGFYTPYRFITVDMATAE